MPVLFDFMRHGEPEGGRGYRGHGIDDPLSDKGWAQMRGAVEQYSGWTCLLTSPLQRCKAFADEVAAQRRLPVVVEDRFKEVGFGRWEGKSPDEVIALWPEEYQAFYRDPEHCRPEGAESLDAFYQRVSDAMEAAAAQHDEESLLVVAHAGVIRAAIAYAAGAPASTMYRYKIPYAGFTRIRSDGKAWSIEYVNGQP
jgi:probable phosphoglycerate mutase